MELMEVLEQRRAVREFRAAPVERSLIERLIRTATLAPSAMNLQPWAFTVVTGIERIDEYARRAREYLLGDPQATGLSAAARAIVGDPAFSMFYHAPVLIMVLAKSDTAQAREDCCLAAQTLMLAARDSGLGTCWIGFSRPWLNLPQIKPELGIAPEHHVVAPIVLGYPIAWPQSHGRNQPEIHWIGAEGRAPARK
jgi:nitroreductase